MEHTPHNESGISRRELPKVIFGLLAFCAGSALAIDGCLRTKKEINGRVNPEDRKFGLEPMPETDKQKEERLRRECVRLTWDFPGHRKYFNEYDPYDETNPANVALKTYADQVEAAWKELKQYADKKGWTDREIRRMLGQDCVCYLGVLVDEDADGTRHPHFHVDYLTRRGRPEKVYRPVKQQ